MSHPGAHVALLTPRFWPEVRRGTERAVRDLADGLLEAGHRVTVITSHQGVRTRASVDDGLQVIRVPRVADQRLERRTGRRHLGHLPGASLALRRLGPDIAHAFYPSDGLVAARWSQRTRRPAVLSVMGIPSTADPEPMQATLRAAVGGAAAVTALSEPAAEGVAQVTGRAPRIVPPGVRLASFPVGDGRTVVPTVLCPADPGEPRKRVGLLLEAARIARAEIGDLQVLVSRPRDRGQAQALVAQGGEPVDLDDRAALAAAYGRAWLTVLPSVQEAFGLVLAESLACGTPVVATDDGGMRAIVDRPAVGRLFDGGAEALAAAITEVLALAAAPGTREACRARASELSAGRSTEQVRALYGELLVRPG
ncbi:MAG: glycosyltransferase family 4 protein [Solirubrobacterales bacterium]